jgi:hypothetical protein
MSVNLEPCRTGLSLIGRHHRGEPGSEDESAAHNGRRGPNGGSAEFCQISRQSLPRSEPLGLLTSKTQWR